MPCELCGDPNWEVVCRHCLGMEETNEFIGYDPEVGERAYLSIVEDKEEED